ncbi:Lyso-phosphatidylcholine acyltransferase [Lecanora helva]
MPKKRAPTYDTKPRSPAHPSLSSEKSRDASHSLLSGGTSSGNSVNEKIQQLRLERRPITSSAETQRAPEFLNHGVNHSLPPSLRSILQIPDTPPPRPRPGLRVTGGRRRPAGPAAPQSWLTSTQTVSREKRQNIQTNAEGEDIHIEPLPDAYLPEDGSLLATTLKALARDWDWHRVYDQYYLATTPIRCKEALLHYIARFYSDGIDKESLDLLFQDENQLDDATGTDGLTHLDLAISIGHSLKISDLKARLGTNRPTNLPAEDSPSPPESWDDVSLPNPILSSIPKFTTLTHLSLAHPSPSVTWKSLLDLSSCLPTLTHLSLAYWPIPTLTPNSKTAYRETPLGSVNYGASNFYSVYDQDWSEAAAILRRLSKSTYCLQWLDLTGCHPWVLALQHLGKEYFSSWGALSTIKIGQGWLPDSTHTKTRDVTTTATWLHAAQDTTFLDKRVNANISFMNEMLTHVDLTDGAATAAAATIMSPTNDLSWPVDEQRAARDNLVHQRMERGRITFERGWDDRRIREELKQWTRAY